jgi:aryl-alcohol dehydrogenase-like predicted oxidoreductase
LEQKPEESRLMRDELSWLAEKTFVEDNYERVRKLKHFAIELGTSLPKLGVAWCLKNQNVSTVILGASKPEQLQETLQAAEVVPMLTDEVMEQIETILQNKPKHPQY